MQLVWYKGDNTAKSATALNYWPINTLWCGYLNKNNPLIFSKNTLHTCRLQCFTCILISVPLPAINAGTSFPTRGRTSSSRHWHDSTTTSSRATPTSPWWRFSSSRPRRAASTWTPSRVRPSPSRCEKPWTAFRPRLGRRYLKQLSGNVYVHLVK